MKLLFALGVATFAVNVHAQADRIVVPRGPAPDQTVHLRQTQDLTIELIPGEAGAIPPMQMAIKMNIAQTIAVGRRDERQRYQATATVDDVTSEMTMNGAPMPMPAPNPLSRGQRFTIQYDEVGAVADVTSDAAGAATEMIKTMLTSMTRTMPSTPIAVGESIGMPINLSVPGLPTGPVGDMTGEGKMTLTGITMDGQNRIAHFDTVFNARLASSPQSPQPVKMEMQISGSGAMEIDVERGLARSTTQTGTLDGSVSVGAAIPEIKLHGTMKLTSTTDY